MNEIELIDFCEEHFTDYDICKTLGCQEMCIEVDCPLVRLFNGYRAALREKTERDKECEYCTQQEELAYGRDSMERAGYIYLDGNLLTADLYSESMAAVICYCPMCGRKLTPPKE